ncbi:AI-2E family transporter [Alteriqipengyuania lutimaris]|uniref:AI-2E family transporter n=1 Tax=Alteriqipengyuania lutimaris TaxID=1538146 RepID=A0A395LQ88_9SPHN|nr:AI-2E family transporter [Alteriqipengyuania lutimaris]MBB3033207.1 putative PurR-regulated permease PerM [Alteriqipengyuania lutimaris]RDS77744.1 AI-2E family transporter [Alteriqipengyuania lutimaris]
MQDTGDTPDQASTADPANYPLPGVGPAISPERDEWDTASPAYISNPLLRQEVGKALIWVSVIGLVALAIYISQALLVIFAALVFASLVDGGSRLIGRYIGLPRPARIAMVLLGAIAFLIWLGYFAGQQVTEQAATLPAIVEAQLNELVSLARQNGMAVSLSDAQSMLDQVLSGVGTVTRAIGGIAGALGTTVIILVIGIYIALEPNLYERGVEWMAPRGERSELRKTLAQMAHTMRRLMAGRVVGMLFEGVFTWIALELFGVPMAALLGILTGLLAFIPNLGALISGILMAIVGFSVGVETGLAAIAVYFVVQTFDGYVVIPMIARKTVDLPPALVLGAQLIMGVLFGIIGLLLADPLLAMIKVALVRRSEANEVAQAAELARGTDIVSDT